LVGRMSPEERDEMRQERRRMFENMSPQERQKWRDDMHRMRHSHQHSADGPEHESHGH